MSQPFSHRRCAAFTVVIPVVMTMLLTAAGCQSFTRSYGDTPPERVWTAMKAVAQTPTYTDENPARIWTVTENEAYIDEETLEIEVFRQLERNVPTWKPGSDTPDVERRTWKLGFSLDPNSPPTTRVKSRSGAIPMHVREEAMRFFRDVDDILGIARTAAKGPLER